MKTKIAVAGLGLVVLVAIAAASVPRTQVVRAEDEGNPRYIEVEGVGSVDVEPDLVVVNVGCQTQMPTAKQAQDENATRMTAVISKLLALGIAKEDIATTELRLYPVYDYSSKTEKIVGYRADNSVQIRSGDLARIGEIVDAAVAEGANTVGEISFSLKDPEEARKQALVKAVAAARGRAEAIAGSSGLTLKGIRFVVENPTESPTVARRLPYSAYKAAEDATTPVFGGQLRVEVMVRVRFDV
ncbi:MAG: SIMPL domain-containing protein [Firmicutes bacterium]|nr:SIMPL domain-containing protein [Bacillota bacterium]